MHMVGGTNAGGTSGKVGLATRARDTEDYQSGTKVGLKWEKAIYLSVCMYVYVLNSGGG